MADYEFRPNVEAKNGALETYADAAKNSLRKGLETKILTHKTYDVGEVRGGYIDAVDLACSHFDLVQVAAYQVGDGKIAELSDLGVPEEKRISEIKKMVKFLVEGAEIDGDQVGGYIDRFFDPEINYDLVMSKVQDGLEAFTDHVGDRGSSGVRGRDGQVVGFRVKAKDNGNEIYYPGPDDFLADMIYEVTGAALIAGKVDLVMPLIDKIKSKYAEMAGKISEKTTENKDKYRKVKDRLDALDSSVSDGIVSLMKFNSHLIDVGKRLDLLDFVVNYGANDHPRYLFEMYKATYLSFAELRNIGDYDRQRALKLRSEIHYMMEEKGLGTLGSRLVGDMASTSEGWTERIAKMFGSGEKAKNDEKRKNDFDVASDDTVLDKAANRVRDRVFEDGELPPNWQEFETPDGNKRRMTLDELKDD